MDLILLLNLVLVPGAFLFLVFASTKDFERNILPDLKNRHLREMTGVYIFLKLMLYFFAAKTAYDLYYSKNLWLWNRSRDMVSFVTSFLIVCGFKIVAGLCVRTKKIRELIVVELAPLAIISIFDYLWIDLSKPWPFQF